MVGSGVPVMDDFIVWGGCLFFFRVCAVMQFNLSSIYLCAVFGLVVLCGAMMCPFLWNAGPLPVRCSGSFVYK